MEEKKRKIEIEKEKKKVEIEKEKKKVEMKELRQQFDLLGLEQSKIKTKLKNRQRKTSSDLCNSTKKRSTGEGDDEETHFIQQFNMNNGRPTSFSGKLHLTLPNQTSTPMSTPMSDISTHIKSSTSTSSYSLTSWPSTTNTEGWTNTSNYTTSPLILLTTYNTIQSGNTIDLCSPSTIDLCNQSTINSTVEVSSVYEEDSKNPYDKSTTKN
ncbi:hypothetical protein DAPPUDRAFT_123713 [Daphnia pulex]|uniref:Uncharacterized protein n=1 Tax=Daphnia pulex TaxID=6669 RepID=E9I620_DAPPU|nr:hypothetical protein DAPPUDRAFT_123713 [Daphnia pulex]|eukprot:EFX60560.1 hypothetical protein DAPPUDRAFT_123713 [Daphnia pulex]